MALIGIAMVKTGLVEAFTSIFIYAVVELEKPKFDAILAKRFQKVLPSSLHCLKCVMRHTFATTVIQIFPGFREIAN